MKTDSYRISFFVQSDTDDWETCVSNSPIGTLQHTRNFINYHSNAFDDKSIVVRDTRTDQIISVFPAAQIQKKILSSHPGAAYGGLVPNKPLNLVDTKSIMFSIGSYLKSLEFEEVIYKPVPRIFHKVIWEEDFAVLATQGATIERALPYQYINLDSNQLRRIKNRNLARKVGCTSKITKQTAEVYDLISKNLNIHHSVQPTHTLEEFNKLSRLFPENFLHVITHSDEEIVAGASIFKINEALHFQYLANTEKGRDIQALDNLIEYVALELGNNSGMLSFGHSIKPGEDNEINEGLANFKSNFGATSVTQLILNWKLTPRK